MSILSSTMLRKIGLFGALVTSSIAFAYYCPDYYDEWVQPQFDNANDSLVEAVDSVDSSLSDQLDDESEQLLSAIAVLTKQKGVAANQVAESERATSQQVANSLNVAAQADRVKQARLDYGPEFGQGYSPCVVNATRSVISTRQADMEQEVGSRVQSEVLAAPGKYLDPVEGRKRLAAANQRFCTSDQVASGFCDRVGDLPGASVNAATLFEPAIEGEKLYDAKVAFVNNLAGGTDGPLPASAGQAPAATTYVLAKAKRDAIMSPALASLKALQTDYSGVEGAESGAGLPLAVMFRNEVKRYAGNSAEFDQWNQQLSAQSDRGALVELLKVKALSLAIQERQYRQYERMEAQLATLVALEAQTKQGDVAVESDRVSREAVTRAIK